MLWNLKKFLSDDECVETGLIRTEWVYWKIWLMAKLSAAFPNYFWASLGSPQGMPESLVTRISVESTNKLTRQRNKDLFTAEMFFRLQAQTHVFFRLQKNLENLQLGIFICLGPHCAAPTIIRPGGARVYWGSAMPLKVVHRIWSLWY